MGLARAKAVFAALIKAELAAPGAWSDALASESDGSDDDEDDVDAFVEIPDELPTIEAGRALVGRVLADPEFAGWAVVDSDPDGSDSDDSDESGRPRAENELLARGPDGSTLRFVPRSGDPAFGRTASRVCAQGRGPPRPPRPPRVSRRFSGQAPSVPGAPALAPAQAAPRPGRLSAWATEALLLRFTAAYCRRR